MKRLAACFSFLLIVIAAMTPVGSPPVSSYDTTAGLPRLILWPAGHIAIPGKAQSVTVSEHHAFVAAGGGGLRLIDVADPTAPVEVASYLRPGSDTQDVVVVNHLAYLADGPEGLQIVDVADPKEPVPAGSYLTSEAARKVAVDGGHAYIIGFGGLDLFDLAEPSGSGPVGRYWSYWGYGYAGLAVVEPYVYLSSVEWGGSPGSGSRCCYHCTCSFLDLVDVSDPTAPVAAGASLLNFAFMPPLTGPEALIVDGQIAYTADGGGNLMLVDISNPLHPVPVGTHPLPAINITLIDQLAYVAAGDFGLYVLDVSDPTTPVQVGFFNTPGEALGVAVTGDTVYVADGGQGLLILSITEATHQHYMPALMRSP